MPDSSNGAALAALPVPEILAAVSVAVMPACTRSFIRDLSFITPVAVAMVAAKVSVSSAPFCEATSPILSLAEARMFSPSVMVAIPAFASRNAVAFCSKE